MEQSAEQHHLFWRQEITEFYVNDTCFESEDMWVSNWIIFLNLIFFQDLSKYGLRISLY